MGPDRIVLEDDRLDGDGFLPIPIGSGLGIELDPAGAAKYSGGRLLGAQEAGR